MERNELEKLKLRTEKGRSAAHERCLSVISYFYKNSMAYSSIFEYIWAIGRVKENILSQVHPVSNIQPFGLPHEGIVVYSNEFDMYTKLVDRLNFTYTLFKKKDEENAS